jgi:hypothetical protein
MNTWHMDNKACNYCKVKIIDIQMFYTKYAFTDNPRLREPIGVASARGGCTQQFSAEYQCRTTQILYAIAMF